MKYTWSVFEVCFKYIYLKYTSNILSKYTSSIFEVHFKYTLHFSKGPFLSHFLYFSILLQIINRMSNINNFLLFLIQGFFLKTYTTMYSYFSTSLFVKLFFLKNFYFLGTLLHYPIFLLHIMNNKQTEVICITSR